AILQELDGLVAAHAETTLKVDTYQGEMEMLLGNLNWHFPQPNHTEPIEKDVKRLPLRDVWLKWWDERPKKCRDRDGMELLRAARYSAVDEDDLEAWKEFGKRGRELRTLVESIRVDVKAPELKYSMIVCRIIPWLQRLRPAEGAVDWLLDAVETIFASIP